MRQHEAYGTWWWKGPGNQADPCGLVEGRFSHCMCGWHSRSVTLRRSVHSAWRKVGAPRAERREGQVPPAPQAASHVPVSHLWPSLQAVLHPLPLDLCCPLDRPLGLTVDTSLFPHSLGTRSGIFRRDTSYGNPHPVTSPLPSLWPPHARRLSGLTRPPHGPLSGLLTPLCPAHPGSTPSCPSRVPSFSSSGFSPPAARSTA